MKADPLPSGEEVARWREMIGQPMLHGDADWRTIAGRLLAFAPNTSEVRQSPAAELSDREIVEAVVEHYRKHKPRACRKIAPASEEWKKIVARVRRDNFTVDQLCQAIDGCFASPHHCGENSNGTRYQALELIVRDSRHVHMFIDLKYEQRERRTPEQELQDKLRGRS